jgi:transposase InsO family protein
MAGLESRTVWLIADLLFAFLVLGHGRRQLLCFEVTRHPPAEWLARQITEAFLWTSAPAYLMRDNDRAYGHVFIFWVRAMGIRDQAISPGSPWQNGIAERLIGTLRRECLDRMLIFGDMCDAKANVCFEPSAEHSGMRLECLLRVFRVAGEARPHQCAEFHVVYRHGHLYSSFANDSALVTLIIYPLRPL